MAAGAGLTRSAGGLAAAREVAETIEMSAAEDLRRAALAAALICGSALERAESRGVHYRTDHPGPSPDWEGRHVQMRND
jgi:aspartate oxidase